MKIGVKNESILKATNVGGLNFFKTKITFDYNKKTTPNSVSLSHRFLKMNLELEILEQ